MKTKLLLVAAFGLFALGGCDQTTNSGAAAPVATPTPAPKADTAAPAIRTGSQADEGACERAISKETSNGDVITLSSELSQANTEVVVGVGPERAKWRCLVSRGKVAEVMSLTNEGAL